MQIEMLMARAARLGFACVLACGFLTTRVGVAHAGPIVLVNGDFAHFCGNGEGNQPDQVSVQSFTIAVVPAPGVTPGISNPYWPQCGGAPPSPTGSTRCHPFNDFDVVPPLQVVWRRSFQTPALTTEIRRNSPYHYGYDYNSGGGATGHAIVGTYLNEDNSTCAASRQVTVNPVGDSWDPVGMLRNNLLVTEVAHAAATGTITVQVGHGAIRSQELLRVSTWVADIDMELDDLHVENTELFADDGETSLLLDEREVMSDESFTIDFLDSSKWTWVIVESRTRRGGEGEWLDPLYFAQSRPSDPLPGWVRAALALAVVIPLAGVLWYIRRGGRQDDRPRKEPIAAA